VHLCRRRGASQVVSPPRGHLSARFPRHSRGLPAHCVSHRVFEDSQHFLKNHGHFEPHCVSHHVPPNYYRPGGPRFPRRWLRAQALAQPVAVLSLALPHPPRLARPSMSLSLTLDPAANALPITRPRVGNKPPPADPARSLAKHRGPPLQSEDLVVTAASGQRPHPGSVLTSRGGSILASAEGDGGSSTPRSK
jgi:hypothetical protein